MDLPARKNWAHLVLAPEGGCLFLGGWAQVTLVTGVLVLAFLAAGSAA